MITAGVAVLTGVGIDVGTATVGWIVSVGGSASVGDTVVGRGAKIRLAVADGMVVCVPDG